MNFKQLSMDADAVGSNNWTEWHGRYGVGPYFLDRNGKLVLVSTVAKQPYLDRYRHCVQLSMEQAVRAMAHVLGIVRLFLRQH